MTPSAPASDPTTYTHLDAEVIAVGKRRQEWPRVGLADRLALLQECRERLYALSARWVAASAAAKGVELGSSAASEEWALLVGTLQLLRGLARTHEEIRDTGRPAFLGKGMVARADGQWTVAVGPRARIDAASRTTSEVWFQPGEDRDDLVARQALTQRTPPARAELVVILAAGNAALLIAGDFLHALFVENRVALVKMHPVNAYLAPLLRDAFAPLVTRGFLAFVEGDVAASQHLCTHPSVDALHITGSDRTYEAIVFGSDADAAGRKQRGERLNTRPFTAELGNISPIIVVPGDWSALDIAYQAEQIVAMHGMNAAFNCLTPRLLVLPTGWAKGAAFLDAIRAVFRRTNTRPAYFPGAFAKHARFTDAHPTAETFGGDVDGHLPWTLITGLHADADDICFREESFCSVLAVVEVASATDVAGYLDRAVDFVNNQVWGNLVASVFVDDRSMRDGAIAAAVDRATARLHYGSVCVNTWGATAYITPGATWGAFPGNAPTDIQSGVGIVNNAFMWANTQKSVHRAPFRIGKKPAFVLDGKHNWDLLKGVVDLEVKPSLRNVARVVMASIRNAR
jgi:acyl-CoA reductase-like NAD-dependent aldehyde dehydrogenase